MRDKLEARLAELEAELEVGERRWHEVDLQQTSLRETLLRISGATQILREMLDPAQQAEGESAPSRDAALNGYVEGPVGNTAGRTGSPGH